MVWIELVIVIVVLYVTLRASKMLFHTLLSPLGLYALIWLPLFGLYLMRLIDYEPISMEMWYAVIISFLAFCLGSVTPVLAWKSLGGLKHSNRDRELSPKTIFTTPKIRKKLKVLLIALSLLSLLSVFGQWVTLIREFGGLVAIFEQAGKLRLFYVEGSRFGIYDYIHIFAFVGAIAGGAYLALFGFKNFISYIPMLSIVAFAVPITARLNIFWGIVLYLFAFITTRLAIGRTVKLNWCRKIMVGMLSVLVFLLFNMLYLARVEGEYPLFVQYSSPKILTFRDLCLDMFGSLGYLIAGNLVSNYAYATNTFAKLNAVVSGAAAPNALHWGTMSFAAFFRIFRKIGLTEEEFSGQLETILLPIPLKPGTYLAQAYYDYGWMGILILPYFLGIVTSWVFIRVTNRPSFTLIGTLTILYVTISYSFHGSLFMHTIPFGTFLLWLGIGKIVDINLRRFTKDNLRSRHAHPNS